MIFVMNVNLPYIPERTEKEREYGITMIIDKGLTLNEAIGICELAADYIDFVKFGFGTALVTKNLKEKIKVYKSYNIKPYFGGTLFEAFVIRDKLEGFLKFLDSYKIEVVEISDGSIVVDHDKKCEYIHHLSKNFYVLSEVGSKDEKIIISPSKWIKLIKKELEAGAKKVITEARESGNVGIYRSDGKAHVLLINRILNSIDHKNIIWEAPLKSQQAWFIKLLGANVNLGNIPPSEIIALETLRLGLRGDTFNLFLPDELKNQNI